MNVSNLLTIIEEYHADYCACYQKAMWNTEVIAGYEKPNGFIVQLFSRKSTPPNLIIQDTEYYEAWLIEDGVCVDTVGLGYDDIFAIGHPMEPLDLFNESIGKQGRYQFDGKIFWIDKKSDSCLFNIINNWSIGCIPQAGALRAIHHSDELAEVTPKYIRTPFVHLWNMESDEKVYSTAKKYLFKAYPHPEKKRDQDLFDDKLYEIFPENKEMRDKLSLEWRSITTG